MVDLLTNSGDPDQMLHSVVSDLGLHCFPTTLLGVSRLQWLPADRVEIPQQCSFHMFETVFTLTLNFSAVLLKAPYLMNIVSLLPP